MPHFKLIYFNARGKAEPIRLLFAEANVPYEDVRFEHADWPSHKPKMPFGQVPVLDIDGVMLPQSRAIIKYLAREYHLDGKTNMEAAWCDAYVDGVDDLQQQMRPWFMEKDTHKKEELWKKLEEENVKPFLARYEGFLKNNGTGFFVGNHLTWADLYIFHSLQTLQTRRHAAVLDAYPQLQNFVDFIKHRPQIHNWLEKRPHTEF